jgi:lipopolysaccharide transport system permease protein
MIHRNMTDVPELILSAEGSDSQYWRDLVEFRELVFFLAWRDIIVRYKQTIIGIGWAVIQPLLTMIIFTVVFGRIAKLDAGGVPYPILVLSGLVAWQYVSQAVSAASTSLVTSANLVSKVYFPRMLVPAASIATSLADLGIAMILLFGMMIFYSVSLSIHVLVLPVFILLATAVALGFGAWLSALTVKYRDVRFAVPFAIQLGLFLSPVGFSSAVVSGKWKTLYALNPMVGIIDGFRWAILGGSLEFPWTEMGASVAVALVMLLTGVRYFRNTERTLADVI